MFVSMIVIISIIYVYYRDFVSPYILKMECGIANVMQQYEKNYKARQLLGPR